MSAQPQETVTFLFTDIEGSTAMVSALRDRWAAILDTHNRLLRQAFRDHHGSEIDVAGDGFFYAFPSARAALEGTLAAQRALAAHDWPPDGEVRVRMGVHTGEPQTGAAGYVGIDVHRTARIAAAGHGGQILLSQTTADLIGDGLPQGVRLVDLGEHQLKDLARPERLFQVEAEGLRSGFLVLRTLDTLPNNLPRHLTTFVGRDAETNQMRALLETSPLVTLTGPGGIGKTRLALNLAADVLERYRDGVWAVELGTVTDEALVPQAVAAGLGIPLQPATAPIEAIIAHLRPRKVLLLLDDCEHLVDACARLADALLRRCPGLRIMATSREPFGIPGESIFRVPPLSLPDPSQSLAATELPGFEALALFDERARVVQPTFRADERTIPSIARICRSLDGIPLAIELAAARVRSMPVEQIAARLDDRFRLLTGGSRVALQRQQTLRAAMDWSHDLLTDAEKATLRRLTVFVGSFTLEAAEAVCQGRDIESYEVLDLLTRLVDKSLVLLDAESGEGRYRLLETVREYAREKLIEVGEAAEAQTRHRDWYLVLVERAKPEFFRGADPTTWVWLYDRERGNLSAALDWSASDPASGDALLRMAAGLWRYWEIRGYLAEASGWLARAIEADTGGASEVRATAQTGAAVIAGLRGDQAAAMRYLERCVDTQRAIGNPMAIAAALSNLASLCLQQGDADRAKALLEEGVEYARSVSDWRGVAFTLLNLASVAEGQGRHDEAFRTFEEAAQIFRAEGDVWGEAHALGQHGAALQTRGDREAAGEILGRALALYRSIGDGRGIARMLMLLADAAAQRGDTDEAIALHREGLETRRDIGDKPGSVRALERLALTLSPTDPKLAARLLGAAEAIRIDIGATRPIAARAEHDQLVAALTAGMGAAAFGVAWEGGLSTGLDEALGLVSRREDATVSSPP
jgi:predicted ATPase/class 3 adenylate cyclase